MIVSLDRVQMCTLRARRDSRGKTRSTDRLGGGESATRDSSLLQPNIQREAPGQSASLWPPPYNLVMIEGSPRQSPLSESYPW